MRNREEITRFAEKTWITHKISKVDIRVCSSIRSSHSTETFDSSVSCIRNYIRVDEEIISVSTLQADIQLQENASQAQTRATCEEICRQFTFFDRCSQINMRIDEDINSQLIVFCFACSTIEASVLALYTLRIIFIRVSWYL